MPKNLSVDKPCKAPKKGGGAGGLDLTPLLGHFVPAGTLSPPAQGDLIEVDRLLYSHWLLYVGKGQVVHVTGPDSDLCRAPEAQVRICSLQEAVGPSLIRVNNKVVPSRDRGLQPLPVDRVVSNALTLVGQHVPYDILNRNCEHYVTEWKYGLAWSDQALTAMTVMTMFKKGRKHDKRLTGSSRRARTAGNAHLHHSNKSANLTMLQGLATILQNAQKSPTVSQDWLLLP